MIKDNEQMANANVHKRSYSIVNIGSVQSYLGTPYRSACKFPYENNIKNDLSYIVNVPKIGHLIEYENLCHILSQVVS